MGDGRAEDSLPGENARSWEALGGARPGHWETISKGSCSLPATVTREYLQSPGSILELVVTKSAQLRV